MMGSLSYSPVGSAATPPGPQWCDQALGYADSLSHLHPSAPAPLAVLRGGGLHAGCLARVSWETGSQIDRLSSSWPWSLRGGPKKKKPIIKGNTKINKMT